MSWSDPCSYCGEHRADCDCGHWGEPRPKKVKVNSIKRVKKPVLKPYLLQFEAEYYCQGYEYGNFTMLVYANNIREATIKLLGYKTSMWLNTSVKNVMNLTIE